MGTKVQNLPGYYSMRDLNVESSSSGWSLFYGDKSLTNGHYCNNYRPSATADACLAYDKDVVRQMMIEHETVFKKQVHELHRLYRIQREMMDEVKTKELHRIQISAETSYSTNPLASQITTDGKKWHISGFPVGNSTGAKTCISDVEGIHSLLDSIKGISKQADLFPSPNGSSSKDVEVLESRPSKVRRKMFDLHLPADEYIDTEESEKLSDEKLSGPSVCLPDRDRKHDKEGNVKLFCGNGGKTDIQEDTSRSEQSLRIKNGLADLNEPVQVEETDDSAYVDLLSHNTCEGAIECSDLCAKQKSHFFGLSREHLLNQRHITDSWAQDNGYLENNGSGKGWMASIVDSGQAKSNLKPVPHGLKQEKSLLSPPIVQDALSKAHVPASDYLTSRSKADMCREKTIIDLEISERNHKYSTNKHPESVPYSLRSGPLAVAPSSDLAKSWSHSASSWDMASSGLCQKFVSIQTPPSLNTSGALSRSSQSHQCNGILGDCWPLNINSKPNPGFHCEIPVQNGFYPGSSSGSKELSTNISSISYDYLNRNNDCKIIPEQFISNSSSKYLKGSNSNYIDMLSGRDINLNVLLSNGSSNNLAFQSGLGIMDGEQKHEDHLAVLPWLKAKPACKNEAQNTDRGSIAGELCFSRVVSFSNKDETGKGPTVKFIDNVNSVSCSNDLEPKRIETSENSSTKKILGIPISGMSQISPKKESSSLTSPSVSIPNPSDVEAVEKNWKCRLLDINLPCDADVIELDKQATTEAFVNRRKSPATEIKYRNQIDLNLSMCEDEASLTTTPSTNVKMKADIDLEVPAVPEIEEDTIPKENQLETSLVSPQCLQDTVELPQDELMRDAAEAIVVMSSLICSQVDGVISGSSESPMVDLLTWFADVVCSRKDHRKSTLDILREKDGEDHEQLSSEGMDYFESMTLKLTETKEEDYMPKPLVPENFKVEETGTNLLPTRTRRGPARRGRQRRDFQRDILPGLASLSRHEVTEDLQTFGGLMRATGHSWHSGLTRRSSTRNGCGRGRRRSQVIPSPPQPVATNETCTPLIQQLNNIEVVGLEDRSLAGWGKTTRRPRRQRCPAGNLPSIPLT